MLVESGCIRLVWFAPFALISASVVTDVFWPSGMTEEETMTVSCTMPGVTVNNEGMGDPVASVKREG